MKRAVDTNILVRYLTWDDPVQSPLAASAIETAATLFISSVVLCETVWVLRRVYGLTPPEIVPVLRNFIAAETVELDRPLAEAGLQCLAQGGDFADGVILLEAERAKAEEFFTFDEKFALIAASGRVAVRIPS